MIEWSEVTWGKVGKRSKQEEANIHNQPPGGDYCVEYDVANFRDRNIETILMGGLGS